MLSFQFKRVTSQKRKTSEVAVPRSAPLWLAQGNAMPRVKRPRRGPPTTPKMVSDACVTGNYRVTHLLGYYLPLTWIWA